ncbi:sce7726 family protein [uncultured Clostridium sp.]|uniref:sce7726 family protein n=1 Tax=uncultured Clostridium sp. TaxID=59620 RepID=UPI0025F3205B|nr:sce7726 family protein [uncultured Clostridium sp.]
MKIYDKDIRKVLYKKILETKEFISDSSTLVIDEFNVCRGSSRADIAVINGKLHGYEIKSEQDTLDRLPGQVSDYNKIFDKVTIVAAEKYIDKIYNIIPDWWGVYCVENKNNKLSLKRKRNARINRNIDTVNLLQLLWKDELIQLLHSHGITKGIRNKNINSLAQIASENINKNEIKVYVKEQLKKRQDWRAVKLNEITYS